MWGQRTKTGRLKKAWGREFRAWLRKVEVGDPISQAALLAAVRAAESAREQYDELLRRVRELAAATSLSEAIGALERARRQERGDIALREPAAQKPARRVLVGCREVLPDLGEVLQGDG